MNTRTVRWIVLCLFVLAGLFFFLPNLAYLAARWGVVRFSQPDRVLHLDIRFSDGWFPIADNDSTLGKILISPPTVPTVIFYRRDWWNPWGGGFMSISRLPHERTPTASEAIQNKRLYPWGVAVEQSSALSATQTFVVEQLGIAIATSDPQLINSIASITLLDK